MCPCLMNKSNDAKMYLLAYMLKQTQKQSVNAEVCVCVRF